MIRALLLTLGILSLFSFAVVPTTYATDPLGRACTKLTPDQQKKSAACNKPDENPLYGPSGLINKIANGVAIFAGAVAVVFIIVGGIRFMTASGDSAAAGTARNMVIYAALGLVIIVAARGIIGFVMNRLY